MKCLMTLYRYGTFAEMCAMILDTGCINSNTRGYRVITIQIPLVLVCTWTMSHKGIGCRFFLLLVNPKARTTRYHYLMASLYNYKTLGLCMYVCLCVCSEQTRKPRDEVRFSLAHSQFRFLVVTWHIWIFDRMLN